MIKALRLFGCILVFGCMSMAAVAFDDVEKDRIREKIVEWQKAALNRESAAETQIQQGQDLLDAGQGYRAKEYLYDDELKANFKSAGDAERKAADLAGAAAANFDLAAKNWLTVAAECKRLEDAESEANAKAMAEAATESATRASVVAADGYELAAQAYGADRADDPQKCASASEKAATWREKLAGRK